MTPSQKSLAHKRAARSAERKADENASQDCPWSLGNVRVWQTVMCRALDARSAVIQSYLTSRSARS